MKMRMQTPEARREAARLRSERYRRRKGIPPRKPAERPWLALGISRSTWYRRRKQAREAAARDAVFDRLAYQLAELRACLDRAAAAHAVMARELSGDPMVGV